MKEEKYYSLVVLLLISKGPPLNDSYKIIRVLEWRFKFLNNLELFDFIRTSGYVKFELKNGVYFYELTNSGKEYLSLNKKDAKVFFLNKYPESEEFINDLFS